MNDLRKVVSGYVHSIVKEKLFYKALYISILADNKEDYLNKLWFKDSHYYC